MDRRKTSRREFIAATAQAAAAAGAGLAFSSLPGCGKKKFSTDPNLPNIIVITADDLGWMDLSCYGNREIATPNVDRLSEEGARCKKAFVVSSSCAPSRAGFLTGQYPHTNGVDGLTHIYKTKSLSPFSSSLPKLLHDAGYNTAIEGKWHVSPYLPTSWYGYNRRLSGIFPRDMWIQNSQKTTEFIRKNKNNRFYLEINYMNNHRDDRGEFRFAPGHPVDPGTVRVPSYWTLPQWPEIKTEVAMFYSQTMRMDSMIGDVLHALDEHGLTKNTIVVFFSDNGPPFPGNKMTLYDRGVGTPLLIRWPKVIGAGIEVDQMINTIDIMPTLLEAAGIKVPDKVQGKSFLHILRGDAEADHRDAVFTEMTYHVHYIPTRAARTRRWKYIRNYSDIAVGLDQNNHMDWAHRLCELPNQPWKSPRVHEELYDLSSDAREQRNLAGKKNYVHVLEEMRRLLDTHMSETNDPYLGKTFTQDYRPGLYKKSVADVKYK